MNTCNDKKAGTSLLELLIAVAILVVVISGLCGLVLQGKEISGMARSRYKATVLARNQVEKARNTDFEVIAGLAENGVVVNQFGEADPDGHFRRTTTVRQVDVNLLEIEVEVAVKNRRTLVFTTPGERLKTYIALYKTPEE